MPDENPNPEPLAGLLAGIAGGLAASLAMDGFQALWGKLVPMPESDEPATVKAAEKLADATGSGLAKSEKEVAGQLVHYAFGAVLGGAYGLIAEYRPQIKVGAGSLFGLAGAVLFDEIAVPAAGLSGPTTAAPPATHAYALASHLIYGLATEGGRGFVREAIAAA